MSESRKYVFADRAEALANKPVDEKDRFRLYACTLHGQTFFVWERHGMHGGGRAAVEMGMTIELVDEKKLREVASLVASMTPEEKAELVRQLTGGA